MKTGSHIRLIGNADKPKPGSKLAGKLVPKPEPEDRTLETRGRVKDRADSASDLAQAASIEARQGMNYAAHTKASDLHEQAAQAHEAAARMEIDKKGASYHTDQAKGHREAAIAHDQQAQEIATKRGTKEDTKEADEVRNSRIKERAMELQTGRKNIIVNFNPDQPRDEQGRWAPDGAGGGGGGPVERKAGDLIQSPLQRDLEKTAMIQRHSSGPAETFKKLRETGVHADPQKGGPARPTDRSQVMKIITSKGTYVIRGPYTPCQLRRLYDSFKQKYPTSTLTIDQWLVERGKVYFKLPGKESHGSPNALQI